MHDNKALFSELDLFNVLRNQTAQLSKAVDNLSDGELLGGDQTALEQKLVAAFSINIPVLDLDAIKPSQREVDRDVSRDPMRFFDDRSRPFYVKATEVSFRVPYKGDTEVFRLRPSSYSLNLPKAEVESDAIVVRVVREDQNGPEYRKSFDATVNQIQTALTQLRSDCAGLENTLKQTASSRLAQRREKRRKDQGLMGDLGFGDPK